MTNQDMVKEFNRAFQIATPDTPQPDLFTTDPKLVKLKYDLIAEEVEELRDAIEKQDLVETVDALADTMYVLIGAALAFGIDIDEAFRLVHESNMSKLCPTEENAIATVEWYKTQKTYDSPAYRRDEKTGLYIVYNKSSGKILKSISYKPVDLRGVAATGAAKS